MASTNLFYFVYLYLIFTLNHGTGTEAFTHKSRNTETELVLEDDNGNQHVIYLAELHNVSVNVRLDLELDKGEKVDLNNISSVFATKTCRQISRVLKGSDTKMDYALSYKCFNDPDDASFTSIVFHLTFFGLIFSAIMAIFFLIARSCLIITDTKPTKSNSSDSAYRITALPPPMKITAKDLQNTDFLQKGYVNRVLVFRPVEGGKPSPPLAKAQSGKEKKADDSRPAVMQV